MVGSHEDGYAVNKARVAELNARTSRIRQLNDAFRTGHGSGMLAITNGVRELGPQRVTSILAQVRAFAAFSDDNDPYLEHDFGSIDTDGVRVFWKIDCYDKQLEYGSPDPASADVTARVLTVMLAEEY